MGTRSWLNSLVGGYHGVVPPLGQLLLGRAPEEVEEWSYGNSPFKDKPISGVSDVLPQLQERRVPQVVDALSFAPVGGAAKGGSFFLGAMKPKGGNWLPRTLEQIAHAINKPPLTLTGEELVQRAQESERMARNWLQKYAGTREDPLKDIIPYGEGNEQRTFENLTDEAFGQVPEAWFYERDPYTYNKAAAGQWPAPEYIPPDRFVPGDFGLPHLRPGEPVYAFNEVSARGNPRREFLDYMGHVGDTLREVPTADLKRWDLIRAVRETARRDDLAQKALSKDVEERKKAAALITRELPIYDQHPSGLNWYRFDKSMDPETRDLGLAVDTAVCEHCVASVGHNQYGYKGHVPQRDLVTRKKVHPSLPDRSGYAEDVAQGMAEIYSLRDPKSGEVLATIEARRSGGEEYSTIWDIEQIKGPNNRKPSPKAIPAIQDFVRNWTRGDVYELENADMWKFGSKGLLSREEVIQDMLSKGWTGQAIATNPSSVEKHAKELAWRRAAEDMGVQNLLPEEAARYRRGQ